MPSPMFPVRWPRYTDLLMYQFFMSKAGKNEQFHMEFSFCRGNPVIINSGSNPLVTVRVDNLPETPKKRLLKYVMAAPNIADMAFKDFAHWMTIKPKYLADGVQHPEWPGYTGCGKKLDFRLEMHSYTAKTIVANTIPCFFPIPGDVNLTPTQLAARKKIKSLYTALKDKKGDFKTSDLAPFIRLFDQFFFFGVMTGHGRPRVYFKLWRRDSKYRKTFGGELLDPAAIAIAAANNDNDNDNDDDAAFSRDRYVKGYGPIAEIHIKGPSFYDARQPRRPLRLYLRSMLHEMVHGYVGLLLCRCADCFADSANTVGLTTHGPMFLMILDCVHQTVRGTFDPELSALRDGPGRGSGGGSGGSAEEEEEEKSTDEFDMYYRREGELVEALLAPRLPGQPGPAAGAPLEESLEAAAAGPPGPPGPGDAVVGGRRVSAAETRYMGVLPGAPRDFFTRWGYAEPDLGVHLRSARAGGVGVDARALERVAAIVCRLVAEARRGPNKLRKLPPGVKKVSRTERKKRLAEEAEKKKEEEKKGEDAQSDATRVGGAPDEEKSRKSFEEKAEAKEPEAQKPEAKKPEKEKKEKKEEKKKKYGLGRLAKAAKRGWEKAQDWCPKMKSEEKPKEPIDPWIYAMKYIATTTRRHYIEKRGRC